MDIATRLQSFENSLSSYTGGDPLDPWDKFVRYLERRDATDSSEMSQVLEKLVHRFQSTERYANDIRYVKYCITYAGLSSDPLKVFSHLFGKGVGSRTAALYVSWAQLLEQRGSREQAEAVLRRAVENQAQPEDTLLAEYRQFQARTRSHTPGPNPLQNSQRTNQMLPPSEAQAKGSIETPSKSAPAATKDVIFVSRSETSEWIHSRQGGFSVTVSEYQTEALLCDGSELSFEEVRAAKYQRVPPEAITEQQHQFFQQKRDLDLQDRNLLDMLNQDLNACDSLNSSSSSSSSSSLPPPSHKFFTAESAVSLTHQPPEPPGPSHLPSSSRRPLGLRLHTEPPPLEGAANPLPLAMANMSGSSLVQNDVPPRWAPLNEGASVGGVSNRPAELRPLAPQELSVHTEAEERLNMSQGVNLSHHTPNTSLGFVQATPSRALPSPTVNTREALDVIMDMFQAPPRFDDTLSSTSLLYGHREAEPLPPSATPFTVFQDHMDQENACVPAAPPAPLAPLAPPPESCRPMRGLSVSSATSKPSQATPPADMGPDETAEWGARCALLAACPNSTSDFAMLAHFVSTPFAHKTPSGGGHAFPDKENISAGGGGEDDEVFTRWPLKKLSPIMEQSPLDETAVSQLAPPSNRHGTIVGEGLASTPSCLATSSASSTLVQAPPPAALSFRDPTVSASGPGWDVYTGPEAPPPAAAQGLATPHRGPLAVMEEPAAVAPFPAPLDGTPGGALGLEWMNIGSPAKPDEADLDVFLSPRPLGTQGDVPMTPEHRPVSTDVPMSPMDAAAMMSPERPHCADVSMNAAVTPAKTPGPRLTSDPRPGPLIPDPWDGQLISELLSALTPPLADHPNCVTWQCSVPAISPKTTVSMGGASLRVDGVLGQGAFATVYQASDPMTSAKAVLKVQKPANPWEFYINTQLDARLEPRLRHLYGRMSSAHLFHNGSVLLGELHNYGTLLNAINIYRKLSEKVLAQPLVMFLAACVLQMVEQLHAVGIVHADIKPDNFMLGERFLEDKQLDGDGVDHGLVLIDLGQSIDMRLFPPGAAFTTRCCTSGFQCTEMLSGKPWSYQTDYFGIAATVHCMLFGTYMQVTNEGGVWRSNGVFRRNPHGELWADFFHTLLNVPDCSSLPDLRGLRSKLTEVLRRDYSGKLPALKSRLLVQLLENRRAAWRQHSL